jgi:hypothetical protein
MIHKKILDVAQSNPNASLRGIADHVDGASELFVERVLEEYGDPATDRPRTKRADGHGESTRDTDVDTDQSTMDDSPDQETELKIPDLTNETKAERRPRGSTDLDAPDSEVSAESDTGARTDSRDDTSGTDGVAADRLTEADSDDSGSNHESQVTDPAVLTDKQWETLRAVHREPTATQEEIATTLDVTRATVSKRVNEIDGFDWTNRRAFVKQLFDEEPGDGGPRIRNRPTRDDQIHDLESRISSLEERIGDRPVRSDTAEWDPDLAHKIIHACLDAEYLSKEDELALLRRIL